MDSCSGCFKIFDVLEEKKMAKHTIYLAGGCFWGTEKYLSQIDGVLNTTVGYANGPTENPTYRDVCASSGHVETVKIEFDDTVIPLKFLLDMFYMIIDPVSLNKQGEDIGIQYRTGVYYVNSNDKSIIEKSLAELQNSYSEKLVVECKELENFYEAEEYHQKYLEKNPNGYCHVSESYFKCASKATPPLKIFKNIRHMNNLRDLGGYRCKKDGKVSYTVHRVFLRGDTTARLTYDECQLLIDNGLTLVVDLRSSNEIAMEPSAFRDFKGVKYLTTSMLDHINSAVTLDEIPDSLEKLYCGALEVVGADIAMVIRALAENKGAALFNCSAGKDRTGIVAMLLLDLVGVDREDIIKDYCETEKRIELIIAHENEMHKRLNIPVPEKLLHAEKETAQMFLDYLYKKHNGAEQYLLEQGLDEDIINKVKAKFIY